MQNESDWIMKQIRSFAEGLGVVLSNAKGTQTEIIFPQKEEQVLPHQAELKNMLQNKQYVSASKRLLALQYAMPEKDFLKLGIWFYDNLNQHSDSELQKNHYSRASIITGLKQLEKMTDFEIK